MGILFSKWVLIGDFLELQSADKLIFTIEQVENKSLRLQRRVVDLPQV